MARFTHPAFGDAGGLTTTINSYAPVVEHSTHVFAVGNAFILKGFIVSRHLMHILFSIVSF